MAKIVFMGSPEIAVASLEALHRAGHQIVAVVTQPDKPKGRGLNEAAPAVKLAAERLGLAVLQPAKIKTPEFTEQIRELAPDFIAVVAYGKILPAEILQIPPGGCINVHFSLLPKYRGAACVAYALINGDDESGTTTILMDAGMDTGPILMQWSEPVSPEDTAGSLAARLAPLGAEQLVRTIAELEKQDLEPVPQRNDRASLAPLLSKEQGKLDWSKPASELVNLYRGLTPWPGVYGFLKGRRLIFTELRLADGAASLPAGSLEVGSDQSLHIHCGQGRLEVRTLKPEGKNLLKAAEFVRGLPRNEALKMD